MLKFNLKQSDRSDELTERRVKRYQDKIETKLSKTTDRQKRNRIKNRAANKVVDIKLNGEGFSSVNVTYGDGRNVIMSTFDYFSGVIAIVFLLTILFVTILAGLKVNEETGADIIPLLMLITSVISITVTSLQ